MDKKQDKKVEEKKIEDIKEKVLEEKPKQEEKETIKKQDKKVEEKKNKKKEFALVDSKNVRISHKHSIAICKFIKNKKINYAIKYLEDVEKGKKPIPMKGEIPHRKGKIMSGRFPKNASKEFIKLLKSLSGNADYNEISEPIITEAIANIGSRPYGRFGSIRRKRTHIKLVAKEKKENSSKVKRKNKIKKK